MPKPSVSWCPSVQLIVNCCVARHALSDLEKLHGDFVAEKKTIEDELQVTKRRLREVEHVIDDEERESSKLGIQRHRIVQQLQDERELHSKDLAERDFASDQTRKKYQGESCEYISLLTFHLRV